MTNGHTLNRRHFLYGSAVVTGSIAGFPTASTLAQTPSPAVPATFQEAPQLAEQTAGGALPPVAERLPVNPMVLTPVDQVGTYGGDWNTATSSQGSGYEPRTMGYENLVRWKPGRIQFTADDVIPNVAERFEVNEDGSEYTFFLREGMKWSDGEPFTAADLMFWYNDVLMNEELTPAFPSWLEVNGEPLVVEQVDDVTVVFRFAGPNALFLPRLATNLGEWLTVTPAHYLRQFHKDYTPDVVQRAEEQELADWMALFGQQAAWRNNADIPVLFAWQMSQPIGEDPQRFIASRNPYYWKVDTEGNQLPYLDRILYDVVTEPEVMLLRALNGELDLVTDYVNELRNKPVFFDEQESGNFQIFDMEYTQQARTVISLNMTHPDAAKREVFANKDFRVGLSHALDRQAMIETIYVGQGEPFQLSPRPESDFYHERLAKQYTEYNVDLANEHLDRVLPEKNGDGIRLMSNGEPFVFQLEYVGAFRAEWNAIVELAQQYWQAVGIDMRPKSMERGLLEERRSGNQHDAMIWEGEGGLEVFLDPRWYFPHSIWSYFAIPWANWYQQGGLLGEADVENSTDPMEVPPESARRQMELFQQIEATIDTDEQRELMTEILDIAADEFYCMGITLPMGGYGAFRNGFHNVRTPMQYAWLAQTPASSNPCQFFETSTPSSS